jgi:hypothetical protein
VFTSGPLGGVGRRYTGNGYHLLQGVDGGPPGVLPAGPIAATTKVVDDIDGGPLGVLLVGPIAATIEVIEDIDGGPPGGAASGSGSGHHQSSRRG